MRKPKGKRLKMKLNAKPNSLLWRLKNKEKLSWQLRKKPGELILRLKRRLPEPSEWPKSKIERLLRKKLLKKLPTDLKELP